ncbi:MAG: cytochrome c-type biogenesis CcmF C-terminal domain-containing protein, partial [Chloroflexota bacterium]|nr:cytochrome c-type biogenesis CcmF C-terminal domain-containing protein [Chloroflexota bacterium]
MIQKRRGMLKVWNIVLLIITFELTIFGTFLTRSGVLSSVHSFSESGMGPFFFSFIVVTTLAAVLLLLFRVRELRSENELDSLVSRESTFLLNNLVLLAVAFATFWGTIFPLISEWVRGVKITVSVPFYNQVNGPILLLLILLMGICPLIGWRRASVDNFLRNFLYPLALGLAAAVGLWLIGVRQPFALLSLSIIAFVAATIFLEWFRGVRARARLRGENPLKAFLNVTWANKPRYGGYIIHLAILMIAVGLVGLNFYKSEKEATLLPGETMSLGSYTMKYEGKSEFNTPSRNVTVATLSLYNSDGKSIGFLNAKKFLHRYYDQPVTEVAIYTTPLEDFYVILGAWGEDGSTVFKVVINPMVVWVWIGGVLVLVGTVVAFWPDRRERLTEEVDVA